MKRLMASFLILVLFAIICIPSTVWGENEETDKGTENDVEIATTLSPSELEAEAAILIEQKTGKILFSKNEHQKLYPASTTKILTALLAIEYGNLDDVVTVGNEANLVAIDGSKAGLDLNEEIKLKDLLMGLMLPSGNDAANTIAVHIGRKVSNNPNLGISEAMNAFYDLMNQKVASILQNPNSHFANPHGYHDKEHYTTAYDLSMIAREAMNYPVFREIVKTYAYDYPDWNGVDPKDPSKKEIRYWRNKNRLIIEGNPYYYEYATGIKTGYTSAAGHCLVSSASKDGLDVIAVVLNSTKEGQWTDSLKLLKFGIENFTHYDLVKEGEVIGEPVYVENHSADDSGELLLVAEKAFGDVFFKPDIQNIEEKIEINPEITAPISKGEVLGKVTYMLKGTVLFETNLLAGRDVAKKTIFNLPFPDDHKNSPEVDPQTNQGKEKGRPAWYWVVLSVIFALFLLRSILLARRRRYRRYLYRR